MMTTLTILLLAAAPALLTALAVLCTLACMPLVWARLEAPHAPDAAPDGWALALDAEMDLDAALEALEASIVARKAPPKARKPAPMRAAAPRALAYTPRRRAAHTSAHVGLGGLRHVGCADRDTSDGVFGVLARRVPAANLSETLGILSVGGRGPPPPSGG